MQKVVGNAMAACTLLNVGTVLSVSALEVAASASFIAAGFFGIATLVNFLKVGTPLCCQDILTCLLQLGSIACTQVASKDVIRCL